MKHVPGVLSMVLAACVHPLLHDIGCAALDVTPEQFGAVGDGVHDDTQALRRAFAACSSVPDGPCHVLLARHYSSGPLRLNTSGVTMDVSGVLSMLPRDKYPQTPADQAAYGSFISTQPGIKDLTITGDGLITGLGRQWWPCKYTGCWRPHLIVLSSVTGVKIGPLHMTDGPNHFIEVRTRTNTQPKSAPMHAHQNYTASSPPGPSVYNAAELLDAATGERLYRCTGSRTNRHRAEQLPQHRRHELLRWSRSEHCRLRAPPQSLCPVGTSTMCLQMLMCASFVGRSGHHQRGRLHLGCPNG